MKKLFSPALILFVLGLSACNSLPNIPVKFPKIDRHPDPAYWERGVMTAIPAYDANSNQIWQVDLRSYDLSQLDLANSIDDLMYASFDGQTKWPATDKMPNDFDWQRILELGKEPGLGIRKLHEQGITGRGVGIAMIDQTLLADHQEYASQLRLYEEERDIRGPWKEAQMHGTATASIAVGKTSGVAPEADLYYIATTDCGAAAGEQIDFSCRAQAIRRIVQVNEQLPVDRKIRVLSISYGWTSKSKGYEEVTAAAEEAKAAGILVISANIEETYGFKFNGLGRPPLAAPDSFQSYEPGLFWAKDFYGGAQPSDRLLIPMDSRTTASEGGTDKYVFYRDGGWSYCIPYLAGMYALAVQVKPTITPDEFWSLALKTGQTIELKYEGRTIFLGPILDPVALIETVRTKP